MATVSPQDLDTAPVDAKVLDVLLVEHSLLQWWAAERNNVTVESLIWSTVTLTQQNGPLQYGYFGISSPQLACYFHLHNEDLRDPRDATDSRHFCCTEGGHFDVLILEKMFLFQSWIARKNFLCRHSCKCTFHALDVQLLAKIVAEDRNDAKEAPMRMTSAASANLNSVLEGVGAAAFKVPNFQHGTANRNQSGDLFKTSRFSY